MLTSKAPLLAPASIDEAGPKGFTSQSPMIGTTDGDESKDHTLELLWILSEREHERTESRHSVPAEAVMSNRPTGNTQKKVPTAELSTMREPKNDTLRVPADQLYNSSAVGSVPVSGIPDTKGFVAGTRWHQTKLEMDSL